MSETNTSWDELASGVDRAANERHKFVVPRTTAHVLTLEALAFNAASPVLLPAPAQPKRVEGGVITGISVIAQALNYAAAHADQKLTVFAHCAPLGSAVSEVGLSELRAQNVLAYLQGDRDAWAASCAAHVLDDVRRVSEWAKHRGLAWPANGGDEDDWKAAYDLYDRQLAFVLGVDDLDAARAKLSFGDPAQLGCGAFWPYGGGSRAASKDEASVVKLGGSQARSADTRVDLLFAEPDVRLPEQPSDEAPGVRVFRDQRFVLRDRIEPEPEPGAICVRMTGMYFDTNKCFLLPSALPGMRRLTALYAEHPQGELLIVGHCDTSGESDYNMELSLDRAKAVAAYLTDDVDSWLAWYQSGKPAQKRWGSTEDKAMLGALPDAAEHQAAINPFKSYQQSRGLEPDGICGPNTRKQLITDYMAQDGTTLPAGITPVAHGCGENFPVVSTADGVDEPRNRRVELYHFDQGIQPAPASDHSDKGSTDYGDWRCAVVREEPFETQDDRLMQIVIEIPCREGSDPVADARYRLCFGEDTFEGRTNDTGMLALPSPEARDGVLEIWVDGDDAEPVTWDLALAELPPPDDREGAKIRLANLGLLDEDQAAGGADPVDGALLAFQQWQGVDDAELLGEPTQASLKETYGA